MSARDARAMLIEAAESAPPLALERLREAFDLGSFETRLVMLAFAFEIDPEITESPAMRDGPACPSGLSMHCWRHRTGSRQQRPQASGAGVSCGQKAPPPVLKCGFALPMP